MFLYVPLGPTQYIFHTPMTRYSLFVLKGSLNPNRPTDRPTDRPYVQACYCGLMSLAEESSDTVTGDKCESTASIAEDPARC